MLGSYWPFFTLFLQQEAGLDASSIGYIGAIFPFVGLLITPSWSHLADSTGAHKMVFIITICTTYLTIISQIVFKRILHTFWMLITVSFLTAIVYSPIVSLGDYFVLRILGDKKEDYGKQRLFGAISWGSIAFIAGLLGEHFGIQTIFIPFTLGTFALLVSALYLPGKEQPSPHEEIAIRSSFRDVVNLQLCLFAFHGFVLGAGSSIIMRFLPLYLFDLGGSETLVGLTITFTVVMGTVVFLFFLF